MKPVTVQEIVDALQDAIDFCLPEGEGYALTTYEVLMERIKAHGIAPPEGYAIVPIEPTTAICQAILSGVMSKHTMGEIYKAMLTAAKEAK